MGNSEHPWRSRGRGTAQRENPSGQRRSKSSTGNRWRRTVYGGGGAGGGEQGPERRDERTGDSGRGAGNSAGGGHPRGDGEQDGQHSRRDGEPRKIYRTGGGHGGGQRADIGGRSAPSGN